MTLVAIDGGAPFICDVFSLRVFESVLQGRRLTRDLRGIGVRTAVQSRRASCARSSMRPKNLSRGFACFRSDGRRKLSNNIKIHFACRPLAAELPHGPTCSRVDRLKNAARRACRVADYPNTFDAG